MTGGFFVYCPKRSDESLHRAYRNGPQLLRFPKYSAAYALNILTAAPNLARCIVHRTRFASFAPFKRGLKCSTEKEFFLIPAAIVRADGGFYLGFFARLIKEQGTVFTVPLIKHIINLFNMKKMSPALDFSAGSFYNI